MAKQEKPQGHEVQDRDAQQDVERREVPITPLQARQLREHRARLEMAVSRARAEQQAADAALNAVMAGHDIEDFSVHELRLDRDPPAVVANVANR